MSGATRVVVMGADHAGFELKEALKTLLVSSGHEVVDAGAASFDAADDYPDFAFAVADAVRERRGARGIVVCGSGVGASIAANKVDGIRASVCHDLYSAAQGVEHDDMNVLCLGARVVSTETARALAEAFLGAEFDGSERFRRRLAKILAREGGNGAAR